MIELCFLHGALFYGRLLSFWFFLAPYSYAVNVASVCFVR